jgi:hypothetical protein
VEQYFHSPDASMAFTGTAFIFSHALSLDLRFAVILPVGTLMILDVFHRSYAYVAHFTGEIQYFYILGFGG